MSDLIEFLLDRLDEAEDVANQLDKDIGRFDRENKANGGAYTGTQGGIIVSLIRDNREADPEATLGAGNPGRILADCEAKRAIVGMQVANDDARYLPGFHYKAQTIDRILRILATAYADHPDYRETWRL